MQDRIKVLMLVTNVGVVNGVSTFSINYNKLIDRKKFEIHYAYYFDDEPNYQELLSHLGAKIVKLPSVKYPLSHVKACQELLARENYDIIHVNTLLIAIPMLICAREMVPVRIFHSHNPKFGNTYLKTARNKLFFPLLCRLSTHFAACSKIAGQGVFDDRPFTVIPNLIELEKFRYNKDVRNRVRNNYGIAEDTFVIGVVGRVCLQKNPDFIIKIAKELEKAGCNAIIWWIGDGPLMDNIKKRIVCEGLQHHLIMLGSKTDVENYYQGMDAFLMPSVFEGFGITCLEAQASGLECFVSDNMSCELERGGCVHFLSLETSPADWTKRILESRNHNQRLHCSESTVVNNNNEEYAKSLELYYKKCLDII